MKKIVFFILIAALATIISCGNKAKENKDSTVSIRTDFGEIKVKLYEETPEHKNNFLKLANEGFYNDLLFHRVINNFMIQGGDPDSKDATQGKRLGGGNTGYTIPAELNSKYFHKKGVLAAARRGGPSNPEKRSSGSQFYIVHGEIFSHGKLDTMEMSLNNRAKNELLREKLTEATEELNIYKANNDHDAFNIRVAEIRSEADSIYEASEKFVFSEEQREAYTTVGGYPSLDGGYTVFGEVVEGMAVLDKIAGVETDKNNRPLVDIKMQVEVEK